MYNSRESGYDRDRFAGREARGEGFVPLDGAEQKTAEPAELDTRRLYVVNLSERTREPELQEAFRKWGRIREAKIIVDPVTQRPRGYAFITFEESADGLLAQKEADKKLEIDGKVVTVEIARGKDRPHGQGAQGGANGNYQQRYPASGAEPRGGRGAPERGGYDYDPRERRDRPYDVDYRRDRMPPGRYGDFPPGPYPMVPDYYMPYPRDDRYAPYPRGGRDFRDSRDPYGGRRDDRDYRGGYAPGYPPVDDYYSRGPHPMDRHRGDMDRRPRGGDRTDKDRSSNPGEWDHSRTDKRTREDPYEREDHRRDVKRDERR